MLEVALAAAGAATTAVASAAEAIDCLRQRSYDFLLSDLGMPEMDGFDLVRAVRGELSISPEAMPAMALSGYAGAQDREHSLACGYQLHSAKPVDLASLPDLILSLAGRGVAKAV
jgi:CheY-like chemotaxis protein